MLIVVVAGCRRRCCVLLIIPLFCCVEEKSDHGRRESNPGPERPKPRALITSLPCSLLN